MQPDYKTLYRHTLAEKITAKTQYEELYREVQALRIFKQEVKQFFEEHFGCNDE